MYKLILIAVIFNFLVACVHTSSTSSTQKLTPDDKGTRSTASVDEPSSCETQEEKFGWPLNFSSLQGLEQVNALDIYSLQALALNKHFDVLNYIYNCKSAKLERLPVGYSAGRGFKNPVAFNLFDPINGQLLASEIELLWHGKIFYNSNGGMITTGRNRIYSANDGAVVPMANFVSRLLPSHPLVKEIQSGANVVVLNYAHSKTPKKTFFIEQLLQKILVYDLMVAVEGTGGRLFVGKTWKGKYDKTGAFKADDPKQLFAWYFLDFRPEALTIQSQVEAKRLNVQPAVEEVLNPLPYWEEEVKKSGAFNPPLSEPGI